MESNNQGKQQGDNSIIDKNVITNNGLYFYNEHSMEYDPEYSYTLMNVNYIDEDGNQVSVEDSKHYVEISPSNHALYINIANSTNVYNNDNYNYVHV